MTDNDLVKFQIEIVIFKDFKYPKEHFKDGDKCLITDCNFYLTNEKQMFEYYKYFMILEYFHIFYNQESQKAIYSTKERKARLSVKYVISNFYFISLVNKMRRINTHQGGKDFQKTILISYKLSVKQSDYINSKWIDIADGNKIIEDNKYNNTAVVRNYK